MKSRYFKGSQHARRFAASESGAFLPFFLVIFFVILGILGLAVDLTSFFRTQLRLQRSVDAAALAAARLQHQPLDPGVPLETARQRIHDATAQVLLANFQETGLSDQIVGTPVINVSMADRDPPPPGEPMRGAHTSVSAQARPPLLILDMVPFIESVTTVAASAEAEARSAIISMVVDVSGSMGQSMPGENPITKIAALKQAAHGFVDSLRTGRDVVALSRFSSSASNLVPPNSYWDTAAALEAHRDSLDSAIDGLAANGRTNASEALFTAYNSVRDATRSFPFLPCYIVFFTDGAPNISTANWVPSTSGSFMNDNPTQNPARALDPLPWYAFVDDQDPLNIITDNHWYRSFGGYHSNDTSLSPFCAAGVPCSGPGDRLLANALGRGNPIAFRAPGRASTDGPDGRLYSTFTFTAANDEDNMRRLHYLTALAMADYIRAQSCTIFSIGLGQRETVFDNFYHRIREDSLPRKDYFLSRLANDRSCGGASYITDCLDEPNGFVDSYDELDGQNALRGRYYPTDDPSELAGKFQDVLANIRLRLNR